MPKVLPSSSLDLAQRLNRIEQNLNILMSQSNITINGNTTGATNSNTMQGVTMGLIPADTDTVPIYGLATKGETYTMTYDASTDTVIPNTTPQPTSYQMQTGTAIAFSQPGNGPDGTTAPAGSNVSGYFMVYSDPTTPTTTMLTATAIPGPSGQFLVSIQANVTLNVPGGIIGGYVEIGAKPTWSPLPGNVANIQVPNSPYAFGVTGFQVSNPTTSVQDWGSNLSASILFEDAAPGQPVVFGIYWDVTSPSTGAITAYFTKALLEVRPL